MLHVVPNTSAASTEGPQKYFKVEATAWTAFDPTDMDLGDIAARIQLGTGVLSAIEVTGVANDLEAIDDEKVRQQFIMLIAIEQIIRNATALPPSIRNRLAEALAGVSREHPPIQRRSESRPGDENKPIALP